MSNARKAALQALMQVTEEDAYANLALKECLAGLDPKAAKWASAAVYTTLDHLITIDHILAFYAKGRQKPVIRNILRLGVCQAIYMSVPESAACNESVKLAKAAGKGALAGYVNGVMRSVCKNKGELPPIPETAAERISIEKSWPLWLVEEYLAQYSEEFTKKLLTPRPPFMTVRPQYPYTAEQLESAMRERGWAFERGALMADAFRLKKGFDPAKEPLFQEGGLTVQSESAMLVCQAVGAKPGMKILDACAAPGGKTAYLASIMKNQGEILAWELHPHRRELMDKTLKRLNVTIAATQVQDASLLREDLLEAFDAVLVDAPCSGLGVPGKPDARYRKNGEMIDELHRVQIAILEQTSKYLKRGGALIYATCTVSKRENEDTVEEFLSGHSEFSRSPLAPFLPSVLRERERMGMLQLFPHLDGTEGFFLSRMVKQ